MSCPVPHRRREPALTPDTPTPRDPLPLDGARVPAPSRAVPGIAKAETPPGGPRPGLREQVGNTKRAAVALARSHVDLAKAEFGEIMGVVKTLGALAGVALVVALLTGNLVYVGTWLFLGEWLFGSLGWGVLHGLLFGIGLLVMLAVAMLGAGAGRAITGLLVGAVLGILVAVLLGSNIVPDTLGTLTTGTTFGGLDPAAWVAGGIGAVVLGLIGLLVGGRAGGAKGAIGGLIVLAILGLLLGLLIGTRHDWPFAGGVGVTVALLVWIGMQALTFRQAGELIEKRTAQLKPTETIETAKETKEWLGQQWANRRSKLGKR